MIDRVVELSRPTGKHQNHKSLFTVARGVKAIQGELGRELSDDELWAVFEKWHKSAKRFLRPGASSDDYYFEFLEALDNAKYALGDGALTAAWAEAQSRPLPKAATRFVNPELQQVVALCRELQRIAGDAPFYLAARTVQKLLDQPTHNTAAFWLKRLVLGKIITIVEKGGPKTNRATRYRYLPPIDGEQLEGTTE